MLAGIFFNSRLFLYFCIMKKQISIFIDFDGTISQQNVGDEIFKKFGLFEPYNSDLKNKKLNIYDYWKILWSSLPKDFDDTVLNQYLDSIEIDPYFKDFVEYANSNNFPITILSDGFDLYIKRILNNNGLSGLKFYSNTVEKDNGSYIPIFNSASESCSCFSASCKRNHLLNNSQEEDILVYIGDGYSDFCCVRYADIIFAKKSLAKFCNEERIPHYPYKSFFDIKRTMKDFIAKNKYKKRNISKMNAKRAYEWE